MSGKWKLICLILMLMSFGTQAESKVPENNTVQGQINILIPEGRIKKQRSGVAVFIERLHGDFRFEAPTEHSVVSQRGRRFRPRTLPVIKGTVVDFLNDDRVLHNAFSLSRSQPFDLGIYQHGTSRSITFSNPGLVKVFCNIHSKMVMNILVLEDPLYTTTNAKGEFVLENIPDGSYTLRVWHEFGEEKRIDISLSGNQTQTLNIELKETRSFVQHKNKYGKSYRSKY